MVGGGDPGRGQGSARGSDGGRDWWGTVQGLCAAMRGVVGGRWLALRGAVALLQGFGAGGVTLAVALAVPCAAGCIRAHPPACGPLPPPQLQHLPASLGGHAAARPVEEAWALIEARRAADAAANAAAGAEEGAAGDRAAGATAGAAEGTASEAGVCAVAGAKPCCAARPLVATT